MRIFHYWDHSDSEDLIHDGPEPTTRQREFKVLPRYHVLTKHPLAERRIKKRDECLRDLASLEAELRREIDQGTE